MDARARLWHRGGAYLDCGLLLLLSCCTRIPGLGSASLWSDELFSIYWSRQPIGYLLGVGAAIETNPPGYYVLSHIWMALFGTDAGTVRALSVVCSLATVPVAYALGRILLGRPTAVLAGALLALSPAAVVFGQEARPYAAVMLLDAVALLALAHGTRGRWVFVPAAAASVWVHYTSFWFVAASGLAVVLRLAANWRAAVGKASAWAAAVLVLAVAMAYPAWLASGLVHSANLEWIGPLSMAQAGAFFLGLLPLPGIPRGPVTLAADLGLLLVCAAAAVRARWRRRVFSVLVLIPVLFCLLLIAASLVRPMLLLRVGVWLVVPLSLLLARAVTAQPTAVGRAMAGAIVLVNVLLGLGFTLAAEPVEDWRGVARLAADQRCGGPVLIVGVNALGLDYYAPDIRRRPIFVVVPEGRGRATAELAMTARILDAQPMPAATALAFAKAHPGTMVVLHLGRATPDVWEPSFRTILAGELLVACF